LMRDSPRGFTKFLLMRRARRRLQAFFLLPQRRPR
jgi:hypothetical protein